MWYLRVDPGDTADVPWMGPLILLVVLLSGGICLLLLLALGQKRELGELLRSILPDKGKGRRPSASGWWPPLAGNSFAVPMQ